MTPPLFDAHCHLQDSRLGRDLDGVFERASRAGVARVAVAGTGEADWPDVLALASARPAIHPSIGLHPWTIADRSSTWREVMDGMLADRRVSVGEIGLDHKRRGLDREDARGVLEEQLDMACDRQRPVIVHGVGAWSEILERLTRRRGHLPPVILHSYGGGPGLVDAFVRLGAFFSFSGIVTNPAATRAREAAGLVPLDHLLVETDAPDLLPVLSDGVRAPLVDESGRALNEPSLLGVIVDVVAALRNQGPDQVRAALWRNATEIWP